MGIALTTQKLQQARDAGFDDASILSVLSEADDRYTKAVSAGFKLDDIAKVQDPTEAPERLARGLINAPYHAAVGIGNSIIEIAGALADKISPGSASREAIDATREEWRQYAERETHLRVDESKGTPETIPQKAADVAGNVASGLAEFLATSGAGVGRGVAAGVTGASRLLPKVVQQIVKHPIAQRVLADAATGAFVGAGSGDTTKLGLETGAAGAAGFVPGGRVVQSALQAAIPLLGELITGKSPLTEDALVNAGIQAAFGALHGGTPKAEQIAEVQKTAPLTAEALKQTEGGEINEPSTKGTDQNRNEPAPLSGVREDQGTGGVQPDEGNAPGNLETNRQVSSPAADEIARTELTQQVDELAAEVQTARDNLEESGYDRLSDYERENETKLFRLKKKLEQLGGTLRPTEGGETSAKSIRSDEGQVRQDNAPPESQSQGGGDLQQQAPETSGNEGQQVATAAPSSATPETSPTPAGPRSTEPTTQAGVEGPASLKSTENLSAAQLNERIDVLLGKRSSTDDPSLKSQYFKEAQDLMAQLKTIEDQSMGPGAASAAETLAQYAERKFGVRFGDDPRMAAELKAAAGNRFYEVLPNRVTAKEASDIIERVGDEAAERMIRDEKSDSPFAVRSTVGQILIQKLNQRFNQLKDSAPAEAQAVLSRAADLAEWAMEFGTRLGQGVQSFAMWYKLSPEGKLATVKKAVQKARDTFTQKHDTEVKEVLDVLNTDRTPVEKTVDLKRLGKKNGTAKKVVKKAKELTAGPQTAKSLYDIASKELGLPTITPEQQARIMELAQKVSDAEEGLPQWKANSELQHYVAQIKGFTPGDFALGYFYGNILSGIGTQAVNTGDTFLDVLHDTNTLAISNPKAASKIYEGLVRGIEGSRSDAVLALTQGRRISSGLIGETPGIMENARFGEKGGVPILEKGPVSRATKALLETKPATLLRGWKYIGRAMSASDAVMFRGAQEARASLLAFRIATEEGLTSSQRAKRVNEILGWNKADEYMAQAAKEGFTGAEQGARATELMLKNRPEGLQSDSTSFAAESTYNDVPKGVFGFASKIAGLISQKYPAFRLVVPFTNIVANVFNRRLDNFPGVAMYRAKKGYYGSEEAGHNAIVRMQVSLGMIGAITAAAAAGKIEITGSGPDDSERKKQLKETGWRPYSVKVGNKYYSYANTPISLGLGVVGNLLDWQKYKPANAKDDGRFVESMTYAVASIGSYLFSQSFISSLSNFFNILESGGSKTKYAINKFLGSNVAAFVPLSGAMKDLDSAFDDTQRVAKHLGESIVSQIPFARFTGKPALNAFGEPITTGRIRPLTRFVNQERTDPAWKLVADKGLRVPVPDPFFKTDEENYRYQKESGRLTKQLILNHAPQIRAAATVVAQEWLNDQSARIRSAIRGQMMQEGHQRAKR